MRRSASETLRHRLCLLLLVVIITACGILPPSLPIQQTSQTPVLPQNILSDERERRETVIWDMPAGRVEEPGIWNPLLRNARRDKGFHQAMIEPLFILNYERGVIEPWLGERMTANSAQNVWTLKLRDGVKWSDGEAFNADDVVFTVNLLLDHPELELDFLAGFSGWVRRVRKINDRTIRFTLTGPNPRFQLDYFAVKVWGSFAILPEHIWHDKDPLTFMNYDPEQGWPVFTGPYTLQSFDEHTFVYVRDDDWWGEQADFKPLPRPKRLLWTDVTLGVADNPVAATEHLDSLGNLPLDIFRTVQEHKPNLVTWLDRVPYAWMDPCSRLLSFNTMVAPWDNRELRWAVNYALDRDEIVEKAYQGTTLASKHFFPAYPPLNGYVGLLEDAELYQRYPLMRHDPQQSRHLIEAQGWHLDNAGFYTQDGQQLTLTIYAHEASNEMQRTAELIAAQLLRVGINARAAALPESEWVERKTKGLFESMIDWDACGSINEPWAALDRYHQRWVQPVGVPVANYNNQVRWANAEYSRLVDEMAPLPLGDPRVYDLFVKAMEIWFNDLPFIPLVQEKQLISFDTTYWTGWPTATNNYAHPPCWWQSTHLIIHHLEPANPQ